MSGRRSLSSGVSIVSHILCDFSPVDDSVGVVISVLNIVANVVVLCYLVNQVPGNSSELVVAVKADFSRSGNLRSNSVNNSKAVVSRRGVLSASSGVTGSNSGGNSRALSVAVRKSHEVVHGDGARVIKSILSLLLGLVSTSSPCGEDLVSVELGGALKNIYAIAAGLADGLGAGQNTKALLITRALAEMSRLSAYMGGNPLSFLGLAGVGDLYVTSVSPLSRNFRIGQALAQGRSLESAESSLGQVAEGVNTLRVVYEQCQRDDIAMPILTALYEVIFGGKPVRQTALQMMQAAHTSDVEFLMPGANPGL